MLDPNLNTQSALENTPSLNEPFRAIVREASRETARGVKPLQKVSMVPKMCSWNHFSAPELPEARQTSF